MDRLVVKKRRRLGIACMAFILSISVGMVHLAHAAPLNGFTGFSPDSFSIVNFAVLPPNDPFTGVLSSTYTPGAIGVPPVSPGPAFNFNPNNYTYLYQVANTGSATTITGFDFKPGVTGTTIGTFTNPALRLDFLNNGSVVNATGNNLQGPSSFGLATSPNPHTTGVATNQLSLLPGNRLAWQFSGLTPGNTSPVFGFQSPFAPGTPGGLGGGVIQGSLPNGASITNSIFGLPGAERTVSGAPEPSTMLLLGTGVLGLLAWRRKQV